MSASSKLNSQSQKKTRVIASILPEYHIINIGLSPGEAGR